LRHGSLFSGIGGFDLAATWAGWQNIFQVEKDEFCTAILKKNFPDVTRYRDIRDTDFQIYNGLIDVLSGGFPCQPFSQAGKRRGLDDDRYLWPEFERAVGEIMPAWVVGENVVGIKNMALDLVCTSLEGKGYDVRPVIIPASAVGAWHRRERIWIIAHNNGQGIKIRVETQEGRDAQSGDKPIAKAPLSPDAIVERLQMESGRGISGPQERGERDGSGYWLSHWVQIASEFCRDNARLPGRVDRIKSLGNAIVPQVAYEIFKAINLTHDQ
jgi:DNA (cytosine-5)-methyltransferase 1